MKTLLLALLTTSFISCAKKANNQEDQPLAKMHKIKMQENDLVTELKESIKLTLSYSSDEKNEHLLFTKKKANFQSAIQSFYNNKYLDQYHFTLNQDERFSLPKIDLKSPYDPVIQLRIQSSNKVRNIQLDFYNGSHFLFSQSFNRLEIITKYTKSEFMKNGLSYKIKSFEYNQYGHWQKYLPTQKRPKQSLTIIQNNQLKRIELFENMTIEESLRQIDKDLKIDYSGKIKSFLGLKSTPTDLVITNPNSENGYWVLYNTLDQDIRAKSSQPHIYLFYFTLEEIYKSVNTRKALINEPSFTLFNLHRGSFSINVSLAKVKTQTQTFQSTEDYANGRNGSFTCQYTQVSLVEENEFNISDKLIDQYFNIFVNDRIMNLESFKAYLSRGLSSKRLSIKFKLKSENVLRYGVSTSNCLLTSERIKETPEYIVKKFQLNLNRIDLID